MGTIGERGGIGGPTNGTIIARWFGWLGLLATGLIVVQAFMAGQWFFAGNVGIIAAHGWVGNVTFLVGLAMVGLAFVEARRTGRWGDLALSLVLVLLLTAQLGLGYAGRESASAAALHVPNGVLLTAIGGALAARGWARR